MAIETIILCTDGSDLATDALSEGLALMQPAAKVVIATVVRAEDMTAVMGTGIAGGVMTSEELDEMRKAQQSEGHGIAERAAAALGIADFEVHVRSGDPGAELCELAAELSASAIVMGSRGRGGIRRAVLGSVSDHVVRNAPCSVVITRAHE